MAMPIAGQFIELRVPEGIFQGRYHSKIQEIKNQWLLIDVPIDAEKQTLRLLPQGTQVIVQFYDTKDTPCEFDSVIEDELLENVRLLALRKPDGKAIRRNQRREYVRVPAAIPVELLLMNLETRKIHTISCLTQNLSGGGMSVIVNREHPIRTGDLVGFRFQLEVAGRNNEIVGKARVLKVTQVNDVSSRKSCGLQFVDLDNHHQKSIIQYVFQRQIELRERGWGARQPEPQV